MKTAFSFLLLVGCILQAKLPCPAYCVVPIADLLSERVSPSSSLSSTDFYAALPLSERQPVSFCCRITQLLFNERVTIIEQRDGQSFIEVPFWHLKTPSLKSPSSKNNRFWTLTKNLQPLSDLSPSILTTIPPTNTQQGLGKVVTLTLPWHCEQTKSTYCAGTQFMLHKQDTRGFQVIFSNPETRQVVKATLPEQMAILAKSQSQTEQRALFVKTLRQWAQGIPHKIPYVLGGASIMQTFTIPSFEEKKFKSGKLMGNIFTRSECTTSPHTGVDCSGLIRLACKVAGIPLTATNSRSMTSCFPLLRTTDIIQEGDLIAWKGHITIITDVNKGLMIEARGYEHFYGYVQEIPYHEQLNGIQTTKDLTTAFLKKKSLRRLDKVGAKRELIADLTIHSLF